MNKLMNENNFILDILDINAINIQQRKTVVRGVVDLTRLHPQIYWSVPPVTPTLQGDVGRCLHPVQSGAACGCLGILAFGHNLHNVWGGDMRPGLNCMWVWGSKATHQPGAPMARTRGFQPTGVSLSPEQMDGEAGLRNGLRSHWAGDKLRTRSIKNVSVVTVNLHPSLPGGIKSPKNQTYTTLEGAWC